MLYAAMLRIILKTKEKMEKYDWLPLSVIGFLILILKCLILNLSNLTFVKNFLDKIYIKGVAFFLIIDVIAILLMIIGFLLFIRRRHLKSKYKISKK
jgi:hypothetical protein